MREIHYCVTRKSVKSKSATGLIIGISSMVYGDLRRKGLLWLGLCDIFHIYDSILFSEEEVEDVLWFVLAGSYEAWVY